MRKLLSVLVLGLWATAVPADLVEDAVAAYERGEYAVALRLFRPLAETGDAFAQLKLAFMYDNSQGVPQDYAEALKWYRKAAEQDLAVAQAGLGAMYFQGRGVPQEYSEAMKWFRKAAEQGLAPAQAMLGAMYFEGRGVPQDYVQAHMWYNLAGARATDEEDRNMTTESRDRAAGKMTAAQIAEAQKLAREWKPKL